MADLQVIGCNWNYATNERAHHTECYDINELVLRRGQPFTLTLTFNRPLLSEENVLFNFETGSSPLEKLKTRVVFPLFRAENEDTWSAVLTAVVSNSMTVTIISHPCAVIGRYILSIAIPSRTSDSSTLQYIGAFVLLFNPWLKDDDVFMAGEDQRQEYVLNEHGVIFQGSVTDILHIDWEYSQFESCILDISLTLLDKSPNCKKDPAMDVSKRNDPKYVCRILSAMVNSKDDEGVLEANWSGNYNDGAHPCNWNSSVGILKKWYFNGFKSVKYGQCWVFGGVLCTVLRCLGIPTRVVTNFNSGQDKDGSLFIDLHYSDHGNCKNKTEDVIWNFHTWNESYFKRRDLGSRYNGWQVIDSCPLEASDEIYRCGPAPLVAIKEGNVNVNYDVRFLFASVNADVAYWIYYSDGRKKKVSNDIKHIGKCISTKSVGSNDRVDVTDMYKYPEGSKEEREVFEKALRQLKDISLCTLENIDDGLARINRIRLQDGKTLSARFSVAQTSSFGRDIKLTLTVRNLTFKSTKIAVYFDCSAVLYTGRHKHRILKDDKSVSLNPSEEKHIAIPIMYIQYGKFLTDDSMMRVTALCVADGTEERILAEKDIKLEMPPISLMLPDLAVVNKPFNANIVITNILPEVLNSCSLRIEGNGLVEEMFEKTLQSLKPRQSSDNNIVITPFKTGLRTLLVTFLCDKLQNLKSSCKILITGQQ